MARAIIGMSDGMCHFSISKSLNIFPMLFRNFKRRRWSYDCLKRFFYKNIIDQEISYMITYKERREEY